MYNFVRNTRIVLTKAKRVSTTSRKIRAFFRAFRVRLPPQANLKDVSDQVNSVVTNAEQEAILSRLLLKVIADTRLRSKLLLLPQLFHHKSDDPFAVTHTVKRFHEVHARFPMVF